ncbi:Tyrosine-type recombinase/integrase (plasmid) [Rhodovastum atsumiense]|uniref:Tyrosine-type recombinase/integrase n=1 Tax=Rhodovastum atsumiense TaxID=504468 RepID=A0A5M6IIM2_9PROT|nr:tyrosine-type recombinase/integrase [Rhodovastum atsumiense]KAA5608100.1 tyrosine-type recombinase/integrase [Rhodovastum atsumiense]CAH2605728.1 Tyrosine-type recombinase/integrase [Rhodovastum atsumiense]
MFGPYVAQYCCYLRDRRYATHTRHIYLGCVAHFARWLAAEGLGLEDADEQAGRRFVSTHLPHCDCPSPVRRTPHEVRAALAHLHRVLRGCGALAAPQPGEIGPIASELAAFDRYMSAVRGLAASTRRQRVRIVGAFLTGRFGNRPLALADLTTAELSRFVLGSGDGSRRSAGTMQLMTDALRCYLRFRSLAGDPVGALAKTIPTAAHWRLASLPEVLSPAEIDQLLGSFGEAIPSRKRAYAMVRCLTDLGLRAAEVARLQLDDLDWQAGTLRIAHGKSRRTDLLPLPVETGRAIADYLHGERPTTTNRAVFVRHVAPYDEPIRTGVVQRIVREAYRRCGWTRTRVHILRHSVASRLLRQGLPLKEIADVLRHRSLDTSAIYAKVDDVRLTAIALPWPGRTE